MIKTLIRVSKMPNIFPILRTYPNYTHSLANLNAQNHENQHLHQSLHITLVSSALPPSASWLPPVIIECLHLISPTAVSTKVIYNYHIINAIGSICENCACMIHIVCFNFSNKQDICSKKSFKKISIKTLSFGLRIRNLRFN